MCLPSAVILNLTDEDVDERGFYRRLNRIKITRAQRRQFDVFNSGVTALLPTYNDIRRSLVCAILTLSVSQQMNMRF